MLYILFAYNVMINVNVDLNPNRNDIEKCKNKLESIIGNMAPYYKKYHEYTISRIYKLAKYLLNNKEFNEDKYIDLQQNDLQNKISVFPNPFSAQTVLQTDIILKNATLTVDNCFGQPVKQIKNISGWTVILFRDNLPSGLYFLRLTENNKTLSVEKLVIID